ncbi:MAG: hypothetical protein ACE5G2_04430 [Candidatus Krumholzibacteriia bacterium]
MHDADEPGGCNLGTRRPLIAALLAWIGLRRSPGCSPSRVPRDRDAQRADVPLPDT